MNFLPYCQNYFLQKPKVGSRSELFIRIRQNHSESDLQH